MVDAPANGKPPPVQFAGPQLPPAFIDQINCVGLIGSFRLTLGNLIDDNDGVLWRQVIVIPDGTAAGLIAILTEMMRRKGLVGVGEAEEVKSGEVNDAQNRKRFN